ncbi:hypothetical protein LQD23_21275 [Chromobacterium violaceum]|uniref:hypothetical protein n=1 Tax=Chromobacterium violaceum TaxID=536 RepID=UPI001E5616AC|nr:hypothetical protein [Chromobacterium violaceum]MCD0494810.1 hypothetical protein [Chromobacterium violaceum]
MTLPASGTLSARDLNKELGKGEAQNGSANDLAFRQLAKVSAGGYSASAFYGKRRPIEITLSDAVVNSHNNTGGTWPWQSERDVSSKIAYAEGYYLTYKWKQVGPENPKVRPFVWDDKSWVTFTSMEPVKDVKFQLYVYDGITKDLLGVSPVVSVTLGP